MESQVFSGHEKPTKVPRPDVHRVTTTNRQHFRLISKTIFGQYIHWYGNRSHECSRDTKACRGCELHWPSKWLGYLDAWFVEQNCRVFLELTLTASDLLVEVAPHDEHLRGLIVAIYKSKGGAKGRYHIEVKEGRTPSSKVPEERDPLPTLKFLWNCRNAHVKNEAS